MSEIVSIPIAVCDQPGSASDRETALRALESGNVLYFPQLRFPVDDAERALLSPAVAANRKNVSFDAARGRLRGSSAGDAELQLLQGMMRSEEHTSELPSHTDL